MTPKPMNRRSFIRTSAVAGAATIAAPNIVRGHNLNSRLNIAMIGLAIADSETPAIFLRRISSLSVKSIS